jgi:hypothetical protein
MPTLEEIAALWGIVRQVAEDINRIAGALETLVDQNNRGY